MAAIRPFRGIKYNQSIISDIGSVITPPYDVIDSTEQEILHERSPYNTIRLEYGKSYPHDNQAENRYTRAAANYKKWFKDEILIPDKEKYFYLYEQSFSYNGRQYLRRGVAAALKVTPYTDKAVLPHELTMPGPKTDRLELLKQLRTNVSPIFTLLPDPDNKINKLFSVVDYANPSIAASDYSGQTHRLWPLSDKNIQEGLADYLAPQPLLIADGHHRYETALSYHQEQGKSPGAGFVLTIMVSMKDPGLLVLPTHRLLSGLTADQKDTMFKIIERDFEMIVTGDLRQIDHADYFETVSTAGREKNGFGFITAGQSFMLIPRSSPAATSSLPVELLHQRILKPLLAEGKYGEPGNEMISYPHDFDCAISAVLNASADAAFILAPLAVDKVLERARQGKVIPQKSTFFYPKLPGGLLFYDIDISY